MDNSMLVEEKKKKKIDYEKEVSTMKNQIERLKKENSEINTSLKIYYEQYIEICRTYLVYSLSSETKKKLALKPGLKQHPYPFNNDINLLCSFYQKELEARNDLDKKINKLKLELTDKDTQLNEKTKKLNLINEKYNKCREEFQRTNSKYENLEVKYNRESVEFKNQLSEVKNQKKKLESTIDIIKKNYEQMIFQNIEGN